MSAIGGFILGVVVGTIIMGGIVAASKGVSED